MWNGAKGSQLRGFYFTAVATYAAALVVRERKSRASRLCVYRSNHPFGRCLKAWSRDKITAVPVSRSSLLRTASLERLSQRLLPALRVTLSIRHAYTWHLQVLISWLGPEGNPGPGARAQPARPPPTPLSPSAGRPLVCSRTSQLSTTLLLYRAVHTTPPGERSVRGKHDGHCADDHEPELGSLSATCGNYSLARCGEGLPGM